MNIKVKNFNIIVSLFLIPILFIDMINGLLLENNINIPLSFSQIYKLLILVFFLIRIYFVPNDFKIIKYFFLLLLFPTFIRILKDTFIFSYLFSDIIKVSKYLTPLIAFFYFKSVFINNNSYVNKLIIKWIYISYAILVSNIWLKIIGLGYPMYKSGNIGSKGFFYAGNEISALLLILSSFIAYHLFYIEKKRLKYILLNILSITTGLIITSKTGILGTFIIFIIIPMYSLSFKLSLKKIKILFLFLFFIVPIAIYSIYKAVLNSDIINRFTFFWKELDFLTFILSNRNTFAKKMFDIYTNKFTWWEKLIGGGQSYYEELNFQIIEIDFIDIFFGYGFIGLGLFSFSIIYLYLKSKVMIKIGSFPYAPLAHFNIIVLTILSCTSGHVYSSGISGFYIGLIFALMFYKQNEISKVN